MYVTADVARKAKSIISQIGLADGLLVSDDDGDRRLAAGRIEEFQTGSGTSFINNLVSSDRIICGRNGQSNIVDIVMLLSQVMFGEQSGSDGSQVGMIQLVGRRKLFTSRRPGGLSYRQVTYDPVRFTSRFAIKNRSTVMPGGHHFDLVMPQPTVGEFWCRAAVSRAVDFPTGQSVHCNEFRWFRLTEAEAKWRCVLAGISPEILRIDAVDPTDVAQLTDTKCPIVAITKFNRSGHDFEQIAISIDPVTGRVIDYRESAAGGLFFFVSDTACLDAVSRILMTR